MNIKQLKKIIKREVINLKEQVIPPGNTGGTSCDNNDFLQCSQNVDLEGRFVHHQPTTFLERMWQKSYGAASFTDDKACHYLGKRNQHHLNQLSTGLGGPNSDRPMGPKWVNQKQSKVDWYECIMPICHCDPQL